MNTKFRFIPFRQNDIVSMCLRRPELAAQADGLRRLHRLLRSVFHFEFQETAERLKDIYAPIDPDADTRSIDILEPGAAAGAFAAELSRLLEKANYERLAPDALQKALTESSLFKIRLHVDFDAFAETLLFCRGESLKTETVSTWLGLRKRTIQFAHYERVVLFIRFRAEAAGAGDHGSMPEPKPGATLLKLFQNVPKADLEMLFPNTVVRMRLIDKLMIGIPAAISGGIVLTTKLAGAIAVLGSLVGFWLGLRSESVELNQTTLLVLLAGVATLGGYLWKQFSSFKNRKLQYMQTLTQNLYFKNLDNNAGVIFRLVNDAEEEECKEAILAYSFLLAADGPISETELDRQVERWFEREWNCRLDFEIDDALSKLLRLELVTKSADGLLSPVSIEEGLAILDARWDNYFTPPAATNQNAPA